MASHTIPVIIILIQLVSPVLGLVYEIDEGLAVGSPIGNVARDAALSAQQQQHGALKFNLLPHGYVHTNLFSVEENTSELKTAAGIDREELCGLTVPCVLDIVVGVLSKTGNFFQIVPVQISVRDINDNPPSFPQPILKVLIPESALSGMYYNVPTAVDLDIGNNSIQRYELQSETNLFSLQTSRNSDQTIDIAILLNGTLDREKSPYYQLHILAMDGGSPAKTGTATINVTVTDVNDHKPRFNKTLYTVSHPENTTVGETLLQVKATDLDFGSNGYVTYYFGLHTSKDTLNVLSINATSGEIKLKGLLDYETKKQYQFVVGATDHGSQPQTTQTAVVINVVDVNDNIPSLHFNLLSGGDFAVLSEDSGTGSFISHLSVADGDFGANGKVDCEMLSPGFELHRLLANEYKVLLNQTLDREVQEEYKVVIRCSDEGEPQMEGTGEVTVKVSDVNDNAPVFAPAEYSMEMYENNEGGEFIAQVSATDSDIGNNSKVSYSLGSHLENFVIDSVSGTITAKAGLDREKSPVTELLVLATDLGKPAMSSTATVYVHLLDLNDMAPTFQETSYQLFAMEEEQPGTSVGRVFAEDKDAGRNGKVKYSLLKHPNNAVPFRLNSVTGALETDRTLDRESRGLYTFVVAATDDGANEQLYSMANVTVHVLDANDNYPEFHYPTKTNNSKTIYHTDYVGTLITVISAHDKDRGENATITFKIVSGNPKNLFQIHQTTGEIFVVNDMSEKDIKKHVLSISASDQGTPPKEQLTKFIIDVELGNETLPLSRASKEEEPSFDNLIIGVTIAVTTVLLVLIITVIIILVRKKSKNHPAYPRAESQHMMAYGDNGFAVTNPPQPISTTVAMPLPGDVSRQVNYSLANETHNSVPSSTCSTFKGENSIPSLGQSSIQIPRACSSMLTVNGQSPGRVETVLTGTSGPSPSYATAESSPHRLSLRSSNHSMHRWSDDPQPSPYPSKQVVDANRYEEHSDLSGDTTNSDSGRGGSEEELPVPTKQDLSPHADATRFPTVHQKPKKRVQLIDPAFTEEPNSHQRVNKWMAEHDPRSTYYQQINVDSHGNYPFPCDSAKGVTSSGAVSPVELKDYSNYMPPSILKSSPRHKSNMQTFTGGRRDNCHPPSQSALSPDTIAIKTNTYSPHDYYRVNSMYSRPRSVLDDDSDIVTDSVRDDDDGDTTTSGSYVIDADELCREINELFFSDIPQSVDI